MKPTIYWIAGPWRGRLCIIPRPRGGDWLADEIRDLKNAGIDVLVSALEEAESEELALNEEATLAKDTGIEFIGFPIADRGVPESNLEFLNFVEATGERLRQGKTVAVHCRQSVGRSALIAATALALEGLLLDEVWRDIEQSRGRPVPDTVEQRDWVRRFVSDLEAVSKK